MQVSYRLEDWTRRRREMGGASVGFVPTMGALHRGHAALVEKCRRENEIVVVSIFVNPTQFNEPADLQRYPQTLKADLERLGQLGVDQVLVPRAEEIYPNGYRLRVEPVNGTAVMEVAFRPGFLQGVLTVVLKLFSLVRADRAYFGEKDFQQLQAVTELAREFFCNTEVIACPTVREASGLAMSSRNALLSAEGHIRAATIFRTLTTAPGVTEACTQLAAAGFGVEYVEEHFGRRFAAVMLEGVRLIDNISLEEVTCAADA